MPEKLFHRNFNLVVAGQVVSLFGNCILRFALSMLAYDLAGSVALFGVVTALAVLPLVLVAPLGGLLADRINKQHIMVALDFATAALAGVGLLLGWAGFQLSLVVVMVLLLSLIQACYSPAVQASVPLLQRPERLAEANAVVNLVTMLANLLGPALGGLLYAGMGARPVIAVSGVCFLLSALMELLIQIPHVKQPAVAGLWRTVRADLRESLRFMFHARPEISGLLLLVVAYNFFAISLLTVGLPYLIRTVLGWSTEWYGLTESLMAVAGLAGGLLTGFLARRKRLPRLHLCLVAAGAALVPMGLAFLWGLEPWPCYLLLSASAMLVQLLATVFSVCGMSAIQQRTPQHLLGKVMATLLTLSLCAQPLGQLLYGLLLARFSGFPWLILGAAAVAVGLGCWGRKACLRLAEPPAVSQAALTQV